MRLHPHILALLLASSALSAAEPPASEPRRSEGRFELPIPAGWRTETIWFPPEFAPTLAHRGVLELRFSPGFFKAGNDELWTYAFAWVLDGDVPLSASSLAADLETYFSGLARAVEEPQKYDRVKAKVTAVLRDAGCDWRAAGPEGVRVRYEGTVANYDAFVTHDRFELNLRVDVLRCSDPLRTVALFAASPQPFASAVWDPLAAIVDGFRCSSDKVSAAPAGHEPELDVDAKATLVGPDVVSTEHGEVRFARSPDGRWALWGSSDRPGGPGGWDVWIAACEGERCAAPEPAGLDSTANDFDPAFAPDGRSVIFFSNRPGGLGGDDLWSALFDTAQGTFGEAVNLGPAINSAGNEWAPTPSADGLRLLFATDGRGGAGRHDLFVAHRTGAAQGWSPAEAVPGAINTPGDEFDATWLADGSTLVFTRSENADEQPMALYWSAATDGAWGEGTLLPTSVNVADGWTLGPSLDPRDPHRLYFSSHHEGNRRGKLDIYAIGYRLTP